MTAVNDWHHPSQAPRMDQDDVFNRWGMTKMPDGKKEEYIAYQTHQVHDLKKT